MEQRSHSPPSPATFWSKDLGSLPAGAGETPCPRTEPCRREGAGDGTFFANGGATLRDVWDVGWRRERAGLCNCYCLLHFIL